MLANTPSACYITAVAAIGGNFHEIRIIKTDHKTTAIAMRFAQKWQSLGRTIN